MGTNGGRLTLQLARRSEATDVAAAAAGRSGRRVLRALAMGVVTFLLSVGIVFSQPTNAQAFDAGASTAVKVGSVIASPAGRMFALGVGTGPLGWAAAGVGLGLLAYQTKDSWWPVVSGVLNAGQPSSPSQTGTFHISLKAEAQTDGTVRVVWSKTGGTRAQEYVKVSGIRCYHEGTGQTTNGLADNSSILLPGSWQNGIYPPKSGNDVINVGCGAGSTVAAGQVRMESDYAGSTSPWTYIGTLDFPAETTHQKVTVVCRKPDGTYSGVTLETTGLADKIAMPSCEQRLGAGAIPWSASISTGPSPTALREVQTITTKQDVFDEWADCFGPTGLQCVIRVWVDGEACRVGSSPACEGWYKISLDEPGRVQCKFGPHVVSMDDCRALRRSYRTDTEPQTITTTNPDGSPKYDFDPAAPEAGTEVIPETGTNPDAAPAPGQGTDTSSSSCWGTGWSWNPVSWVVIPVKCSLTWAFVPKAAPSFSDVPSPLPPGWLPDFPDLGAASCGPVTMPELSLGYKDWTVGPVTMLSTCDDPWPLVRTFTYYGLLAFTLVGLIWAAFRAVMSGVGMGLQTGGGGDDE